MLSDEKLARWAALFLDACGKAEAGPGEQAAAVAGVDYPGVTQEAGDLLRAVDAGGVPAFVTGNLKQIARDNGIDAEDDWTPNQIIEAIRNKALDGASGRS